MLRGLPHLCKYMPASKDARRLTPDPDNEPYFYAISSKCPLPDDPDFNMFAPEETRLSSEPVLAPRLASEVSWMQSQMPLAKRPNFLSSASNAAMMGNADAAIPSVNPFASLPNSQFQDIINSNNQLLATAAALQASVGGLQQPQSHGLGLGGNSTSNAAAIAALLQSHGSSFGL
jgi:hypothetical protein